MSCEDRSCNGAHWIFTRLIRPLVRLTTDIDLELRLRQFSQGLFEYSISMVLYLPTMLRHIAMFFGFKEKMEKAEVDVITAALQSNVLEIDELESIGYVMVNAQIHNE